jgi:DNA-binding MarR family transcriptional regulator
MSRRLIGFRRKQEKPPLEARDLPISKLFFDTFSNRVCEFEGRFQALSAEVRKLKLSTERMQISDLVLLEKIQKHDIVLKDSLDSMRRIIESVSKDSPVNESTGPPDVPAVHESLFQGPGQPLSVAGTEDVILAGLNTQTELQVITMLAEQGSKSAHEIGRAIGRSREHTARLLKRLYEDGYVKRDQGRIPFRYSLVERVRASLKKGEEKPQSEESAAATVPPA